MEQTKSVNLKRSLADSEKEFKSLVINSSARITILGGPDFKTDLVNETILKKIWRKHNEEVIGKE